jgi:hypothetical protein
MNAHGEAGNGSKAGYDIDGIVAAAGSVSNPADKNVLMLYCIYVVDY